jgi:hypothetical protein
MANIIRFEENDIVNDTQKVAVSAWTGNTNNLTTAHTSSILTNLNSATSSGAFFIQVFNEKTGSSTSEVQYAIAYGHRDGSGSLNFTNDLGAKGKSPTAVTYAQYRNLIFGDELTNFTFNDFTPKDIYVININRARYRHNLKPGTLNLHLFSGSIGAPAQILHLTDDAVTATGSAIVTNIGRQFNIVSGSNGIRLSGTTTTQVTNSGSYGLFYPDAGIIILNPAAISHSSHFEPNKGDNVIPNGPQKLYNSISGAGHFIIDAEEKISSQFYFVRARNNQFNYTTNPSFTDTQGNLNIDTFVDNPTTFITTVGLYNDSNDLVAVAKLSQPITKDFTKESLIRVKLDY